ncbi:hypothetical protein BDY24DRAFT_381811 [Mrakia frigida]|uniref:uncharacterized protein n=1 Tax=Mrakia frigida TaxID=29902 RepID=UPI003FCC1444
MSEPSTSTASTSAASLSLSTRSSKRKASKTSPASPPPPPSSTNDLDDYSGTDGEEDGEPSRKKARPEKKERVKKPLAKKVAVWKDIKKWKEGDDPLGLFPLEVLDLIISVDSDLDLRDHLALAATCRYFRTCYRDVVFQVLFQASFPSLARQSSERIGIYEDGVPETVYSYSSIQPFGPFERSLNAGRRIFSSGRSLVGAGGWFGWGLSRAEYDLNLKETNEQKEALSITLAQFWDQRPLEIKEADLLNLSAYWSHLTDEQKEVAKQNHRKRLMGDLQTLRDREANFLREVHGLEVASSPEYHYYRLDRSGDSGSTEYDPWPSVWRSKVARIVLSPSVNKTTAKTVYKVSDRELLGLKERTGVYGGSRACKYYYKAAVEALSLRSHGGIQGHSAHLAKLEATKDKARATRIKNGTVVVKKPKPPTRRQMMAGMKDSMMRAILRNDPAMALYLDDDDDDDEDEGMFYDEDDYGDTDDEDESMAYLHSLL